MLVGSATVRASGGLVASHAYIGWVAKLQAVLAHTVFVISVHEFGFAAPVVYVPGGFFSWDTAWNSEDGF